MRSLPNQLSATAAARQLAAGTLTAETLVRACLDRIRSRESAVQAWESIDPDAALASAKALDRSPRRGLLHGLPVGVKDILDTTDLPTRYGSRIYANHQPPSDAAAVALTRAHGGIILGKTVTTEFATSTPNKTRHPLNPRHTPGGSSSGSAAAVADDMVPLAFGTQTAGSVIRPAAFCGVVGFKPSHGTLPRAGVKATSDTLDTVGVLARCVEDVALFVSALTRDDTLLQAVSVPSLAQRIGVCQTYQWEHAAPETRRALDTACRALADAGTPVRPVEPPTSHAELFEAQHIVMAYETAQELQSEYWHHRDQLSPLLRSRIETGLSLSHAQYANAIARARAARRELDQLFEEFDALLTPATKGEAPEGLESTGDPVMNRVWTLLHVPCVTIPVDRGPQGLPVGIQLVGHIGHDGDVLRAARWLESLLACAPLA